MTTVKQLFKINEQRVLNNEGKKQFISDWANTSDVSENAVSEIFSQIVHIYNLPIREETKLNMEEELK